MKRRQNILFHILTAGMLLWILTGCSASNHSYNPSRKFSPEELRKDYDLLQDILQKFHPSLYWYTPKDSMDRIFSVYRNAIRDSMTEQQFGFGILAPVTTQIRCGHTSFSFSKDYATFFRGLPLPSFPLFMKIWGDTMVVLENRNRQDSVFKRGTRVISVNGLNAAGITGTMFRYMPTDGYAENINYIRLSAAFPYYHRNIFGLSRSYRVGYLDSLGLEQVRQVPVYQPIQDSTVRKKTRPERGSKPQKRSRSERLREVRSLAMDTTTSTGLMEIQSFDNGFVLKKFYRQSFRRLRKGGIGNLVIDIRNNGGGKVDNYTALARYLKDRPFKVADSAFTLRRNFRGYGKYFQSNEVNWLAMQLFATGKKDGVHHFRYWENHVFRPRGKNRYAGNIYLIISGPTFSASSLFCNTMKGQPNVTLVGEETGGGAYGNSGLLIPNATLPHTGIRVRIPLFRLVQYQHPPKNGLGVQPDILVRPTIEAVTRGTDLKLEKVKTLIRDTRPMAQQ
jgi:Peptidase family S41